MVFYVLFFLLLILDKNRIVLEKLPPTFYLLFIYLCRINVTFGLDSDFAP